MLFFNKISIKYRYSQFRLTKWSFLVHSMLLTYIRAMIRFSNCGELSECHKALAPKVSSPKLQIELRFMNTINQIHYWLLYLCIFCFLKGYHTKDSPCLSHSCETIPQGHWNYVANMFQSTGLKPFRMQVSTIGAWIDDFRIERKLKHRWRFRANNVRNFWKTLRRSGW